jgi:magnesium-transporting ATPase (P-type)
MALKQRTEKSTNRHPFLLAVEDVAHQFGTNIETGLTANQVAELQKEHPSNELESGEGISWHKILIKQLSNAMILVSRVANYNKEAQANNSRYLYLQWRSVLEFSITLKAEFL